MWPFKEDRITDEWLEKQRQLGREAFLAGQPRKEGCSVNWWLGYTEAMAEEVQRLRKQHDRD